MLELGFQIQNSNEGCKSIFVHIDIDLEALDQCVDCHHLQRKCTDKPLCGAERRIEVLEEHSQDQLSLIAELMAYVMKMEGQ